MGSRIEHRAEFPQSVADVYAAQTDADVLRARLERLGGKHAGLPEHEKTEGGARYRLVQGIGAEQLPQAVRTLHKGDLIVHRTQTWTTAGDGYTGTATAEVDGVPGEIKARTELREEGGLAVLRTSGEVKVRIPLVGGRLESVIAEQVTKLLQREAEFTAKWLADNG
ncbi:DUF2505 domain-containing protein [Amycolatopsis sp. CA-230715]|uniref:DUF2505 domain-containing protein n=1 Tax=Amycolatopsis sp. CA-230715 TaxID=2745196 RepID=UPI001C027F2F|nr:DUF2505 domain-containing protein [Amycolatopsis sp. CA-230715]QWF79924.1 hypothetical protein HUW46_03337 [Amycolatopsis sp. CA-230715]